MALQIPQIIGIQGNVLSIKHPSVDSYTKTTLAADVAAGATSLSVIDNLNFNDDDHIVIGQIGVGGTESRVIDAAVVRGQSLSIGTALTFDHPQDTQVINCPEAKIQIYSASTLDGAKTLIDTIDIQFANTETLYYISSTSNFYFARFTKSDGSGASSYSIGISSSYGYADNFGYSDRSVSSIIQNALKSSNTTIDNELITWDFLINAVNEAQQKITQLATNDGAKKNWSFEIEDLGNQLTWLTVYKGERLLDVSWLNLKNSTSNEPFISLTFNGKDLQPKTLKEIMSTPYPSQYTTVFIDTAAGSTSLLVTSTNGFPDSGTIYLPDREITYTSKTETSFDGIPAAGAGSIIMSIPADSEVWQVDALGVPTAYAVSNNKLYFDRPYDGSYGDFVALRGRYYKQLELISELGQKISPQFTNLFKDYVISKIEYVKGSKQDSLTLLGKFEDDVKNLLSNDTIETSKVSRYYTFASTDITKDKITQTNF